MNLTPREKVKSILNRSSQAICGVFEKEVVVDSSNVSETKRKLREAGFIIVGTGDAGFGKTKVWFNPMGANL